MKTPTYFLSLLALVLFVNTASPLPADTIDNAAGPAEDQTAICHFDKHKDDHVVADNGCGCLNTGGEIMLVNVSSCKDSHKADGDCELQNIDQLDLGSCAAGE